MVAESTTRGAITLAVSGGGSDGAVAGRPTGLATQGDFSSSPYATIQAAINALPKNIQHTVAIDVAAGSYAGFNLQGFAIAGGAGAGSGAFSINGALGTFSPATGTATGTATGGTNRTLTDTGQTWTVDDFVGKLLNTPQGTFMIATNTVDTITIAGPHSVSLSGAYTIQVQTALLTSGGAAGAGAYVESVNGRVDINDFLSSGGTFGFVGFNTERVVLNRCTASGQAFGFLMQDMKRTSFSQCGALANSVNGMAFIAVQIAANNDEGWLIDGCTGGAALACNAINSLFVDGAFISDSTAAAVEFTNSPFYCIDDLIIDGCTVGMVGKSAFIDLISAQIDNCSVEPFDLSFVNLKIETAIAGAGNTGFGVRADKPGCVVQVDGFLPTITGASGDATVDGAVVTWSSDLSAANTAVANATSGSRIVRT